MASKTRYVVQNGVDNNLKTIVNVADPVDTQDAATKSYVDLRYSVASSITKVDVIKIDSNFSSYDVSSESMGSALYFSVTNSGNVYLPQISAISLDQAKSPIILLNASTSAIQINVFSNTTGSDIIRDRTTSSSPKGICVLDRQASIVLIADKNTQQWIVVSESQPSVVRRADSLSANSAFVISSTGTIVERRGVINIQSTKLDTGRYRITLETSPGITVNDQMSAMFSLVNSNFVGYIYKIYQTSALPFYIDVYIKDIHGTFRDCSFSGMIFCKSTYIK